MPQIIRYIALGLSLVLSAFSLHTQAQDSSFNLTTGVCQVPDCQQYTRLNQALNQTEAMLSYSSQCFNYRRKADTLFKENLEEHVSILEYQVANQRLIINTVEVSAWSARISTELLIALSGEGAVNVLYDDVMSAIASIAASPDLQKKLGVQVLSTLQGTGLPNTSGMVFEKNEAKEDATQKQAQANKGLERPGNDTIYRGVTAAASNGMLLAEKDLWIDAISNEIAGITKKAVSSLAEQTFADDKQRFQSIDPKAKPPSDEGSKHIINTLTDVIGESTGQLISLGINHLSLADLNDGPALAEALRYIVTKESISTIGLGAVKGLGPSAVHAYVNSLQDERRKALQDLEQELHRYQQRLQDKQQSISRLETARDGIAQKKQAISTQREAIKDEALHCELKQTQACKDNHQHSVNIAQQRLRTISEGLYQPIAALEETLSENIQQNSRLLDEAEQVPFKDKDSLFKQIGDLNRAHDRIAQNIKTLTEEAQQKITAAEASANTVIARANTTLASCVNNSTANLPPLNLPKNYQDTEVCWQIYQDANTQLTTISGQTLQEHSKLVESCENVFPAGLQLEPLSEDCPISVFPLSQINRYNNLTGELRAPQNISTVCQGLLDEADLFSEPGLKQCETEANALTDIDRSHYNYGQAVYTAMNAFNLASQAVCDLEQLKKTGTYITYANYMNVTNGKSDTSPWILQTHSQQALKQFKLDNTVYQKRLSRLKSYEKAGLAPTPPKHVWVTGNSHGLGLADKIAKQTQAMQNEQNAVRINIDLFEKSYTQIGQRRKALDQCEQRYCPSTAALATVNLSSPPVLNDEQWQPSQQAAALGSQCLSACGALERRLNNGIRALFKKHQAYYQDKLAQTPRAGSDLRRKAAQVETLRESLNRCVSGQCPAVTPDAFNDILAFDLVRITPRSGNNPFSSTAPLAATFTPGASNNANTPITDNFLKSCIGFSATQTIGTNHNVAIFANDDPSACEAIVSNASGSTFDQIFLVFHASGFGGDNTLSFSGNSNLNVSPVLASAASSADPNAVANPAAGFGQFNQTFTVETRALNFPERLLRFTVNVFIQERQVGDMPDRFNDLTVTIVNAEVL